MMRHKHSTACLTAESKRRERKPRSRSLRRAKTRWLDDWMTQRIGSGSYAGAKGCKRDEEKIPDG